MKKFFAVLLMLAMVLSATSVMAEGTLVMATNLAFPPFEYIDDNGDAAGFDVEIAKLIAADLGKELVVEDMAFDSILVAISTGSADISIAGMTITDARKEVVDFSEPYFEATQQVIMLKDATPVTAFADLATMRVAVQEGTTGHLLCEEIAPADQIGAFKTAADAILELKSGRVDAVVIDTAPAKVFVAANDDITIIENLDVEVEYYGIAVLKGQEELIASIDATLAKIKADGTYDALLAEFFSE